MHRNSILFSRLINSTHKYPKDHKDLGIIGFKITAFVLVGLFAVSPITSQAWFFQSAAAQTPTGELAMVDQNSQTMNLLASTVSMASDLQANDPNSDIAITDDGTALVPELGSAGSLVDIVDNPIGGQVTVYVVQAGDSITSIAKQFGVSEATIRIANDLKKGDVIHQGDTLLILPITGIRYTVKSGDTIARLEKRYGLSAQDSATFLDYNNLNSGDTLTTGQALIIPGTVIDETATKPIPPKKHSKPIPRGNMHVNVNLFSPSGSASDIVRGYFIKPAACPLTQGRHDVYAVDISCGSIGTPIHAAASGVVVFAKYGYNGGYGNLVILRHPNDMTTFYAHIENGGITVHAGDNVTQGQVIAHIGSTGRSTGPHVHFEVRGGGNPGFDSSGSAWKHWSY